VKNSINIILFIITEWNKYKGERERERERERENCVSPGQIRLKLIKTATTRDGLIWYKNSDL